MSCSASPGNSALHGPKRASATIERGVRVGIGRDEPRRREENREPEASVADLAARADAPDRDRGGAGLAGGDGHRPAENQAADRDRVDEIAEAAVVVEMRSA